MDISEFCNICLGKYPLTNVFKKKDKTYATIMSLIGHGIIKEESLHVCDNCIIKIEVANNIKEMCVKNLVYFRYSFLEEKLKLEKTEDRKIRDKLENLRSVQISNLSNISSNLGHIKDDNEKCPGNNSNKSSINNDKKSTHNKTGQFSTNVAGDESNNDSKFEIHWGPSERMPKNLLSAIAALDRQAVETLRKFKEKEKSNKGQPGSHAGSPTEKQQKSKSNASNIAADPSTKKDNDGLSKSETTGIPMKNGADKPTDAKIPREDKSNKGDTGSKSAKGKDYGVNKPIYITIPLHDVQPGGPTDASTKKQTNSNSTTNSAKTNGADEKEGRFRCFNCPKRFHLKEDLISHHEEKHAQGALKFTFRPDLLNSFDNGTFECTECGKTFCNMKVLATHKLMHRLSYPLREE